MTRFHLTDHDGQAHIDPDRIPTPLEVPLTMRQLVDEREMEDELRQHGEAGGYDDARPIPASRR